MSVIGLISDKAKLMAFNCERKFAISGFAGQNNFVITDWNRLQELALSEIEVTLAELPLPLREQAQRLAVTFEQTPNGGLQSDGVDAESLGIFTGGEYVDDGAAVLPSQIILFLGNIWNYCEMDEHVYRDEVRTTFLHELGHFFGLDEGDLVARGLE